MALYHLHTQVIGRSSGKTATAAVAYRATEKIEDRTTGETHDYRRKEKALLSRIFAPIGAPDWCRNRQELWNQVQEKENRKNSTFCREYEVALQSELTLEENQKVLERFIWDNFVSHGLVADYSVHAPHKYKDGTDNKNLHAHIMVTARAVNKDGWEKAKFRPEDLSEVQRRHIMENGEKDLHGQQADRIYLEMIREDWENCVNRAFQAKGLETRIDHRTLEEQGIDREPQQHQGKAATAMERKGKKPDRKKHKPAPVEPDLEVTAEELDRSILTAPEYISLIHEREEAAKAEKLAAERQKIADMPVEERAERAFARIKPNLPDRATANATMDFYRRCEVFWYIKENTASEVQFLQSIKSNDWHDDGYNRGIENHIQTVRHIAGYEDFVPEVRPAVDQYYSDLHGYMGTKQNHWQKIKDWIATTDCKPVAICRGIIERVKDFRDRVFPRRRDGYGRGY